MNYDEYIMVNDEPSHFISMYTKCTDTKCTDTKYTALVFIKNSVNVTINYFLQECY